MYSSTSKRRRRSRVRRPPRAPPGNGAGSNGDGRVAAALVSTRLTIAPASSRVRSWGGRTLPAQRLVDGLRKRCVHDHAVALLDLDEHVEGGRGLALEHRLLRAATPRLLVGQRHRLDAAEQVVERRVDQQRIDVGAVRGADELHAALGDRPRRDRLELGADLVDDDALGHVVLDRLDHHRVLQRRGPDLHPARTSDARVRDVAVAGDLVRRVDDDHALAALIAEHARALAQHRRLADARRAEQQDRLAADDHVLDDVDGSGDRAADPAGQSDDRALAVADRADAVQRAFDPRAVVVTKETDVLGHVVDLGVADIGGVEDGLTVGEPRLGLAAEVEHHLEEVAPSL